MSDEAKLRVVVVGAGSVGVYMSCVLSLLGGYEVHVYEARGDIRKCKATQGKSINLTLSTRGREALRLIGIEDQVVSEGVPMRARWIHGCNGSHRIMEYGTNGENLISIERSVLNECLLNTVEEKYGDQVTLHFNHKLQECDFESGQLVFKNSDGQQVHVKADVIFGCDGAYSTVRGKMIKTPGFDYCQSYSNHGYTELTIPPQDGQPALQQNFLHVWPKCECMMIAQPNKDNSFTATLFVPHDTYDKLKTEDDVMEFWNSYFEGTVHLIGEEAIKRAVLGKKPWPLMTVRCHPYHAGSVCALMGDAAHAMLPFYGQGVNCGFEDCLVFYDLMIEHNKDLCKYDPSGSTVLPEYTKIRYPDANAMCDLSEMNYREVSSKVKCKWFCLRKKCERVIHRLLPSRFTPLYSMVAFSRMRYSDVVRQVQVQDRVVNGALMTAVGVTTALLVWMAQKAVCGCL